MTTLNRKLRRVVKTQNKRDLVVILEPSASPTIEVREKSRRSGYKVTVAALYTILAQREADRAVAMRRLRRLQRRDRGRA